MSGKKGALTQHDWLRLALILSDAILNFAGEGKQAKTLSLEIIDWCLHNAGLPTGHADDNPPVATGAPALIDNSLESDPGPICRVRMGFIT